MYDRCFVCRKRFGSNDVIASCPVGTRLAYDPAKGRLWVVCRRCGQWCLTPLEERWEALEQCERAFQRASARTSTDNVTLAQVTRRFSLIRVGETLRDELANWRYGPRLARRRRRTRLRYATLVAAIATAFTWAAVAASSTFMAWYLAMIFVCYAIWLRGPVTWWPVVRLQLPSGRRITVLRGELSLFRFEASRTRKPVLELEAQQERARFVGDAALALLARILPHINWGGATPFEIRAATREVDAAESSAPSATRKDEGVGWVRVARRLFEDEERLTTAPAIQRLALEMAVSEELERRAMLVETGELAEVWHEEEAIAAEADDMFLPTAIVDWIKRRRLARS